MMKKATQKEHTPGPWQVSQSLDYFDEGATVVRTVNIPRGCARGLVVAVLTKTDECSANARLIAAAPELLEALRETLDELESIRDALSHPRPTSESAVCHRARLAIAKAEGREHVE